MSLQMKSYFAATVQAAMLRAREELGPDALLLHSRPTSGDAKHLGEYEVVFALGTGITTGTDKLPATETSRPSREPDARTLRNEVAELRREMSRIAAAIGRPGWGGGEQWVHPEFPLVRQELSAQEMDQEWLDDLLRTVEQNVRPEWPAAMVRAQVDREIERQILVDSTLGVVRQDRQIVAVAGPTGAGKTTTLVKLAARYGLTARRSTQILTLDTERVAATEQLRSYAAILGMGFQVVDGGHALSQALEECRHKQYIFIDTPGFGGDEATAAQVTAECLAASSEIDVHLVVPAPFRTKDLTRVIDRYAIFKPDKLLFSKLDETETIGPLLNEARRMRLPISFLSTGQQIPEDLLPATAELLLSRLWGRSSKKASAAA